MERFMSEIKAGDRVRLKSGGPTMTVSRLEDNGLNAVCGWFDGKKEKLATFAVVMLERVDS
jgi:uncharacterized protein YodC (DUF2158 family)